MERVSDVTLLALPLVIHVSLQDALLFICA